MKIIVKDDYEQACAFVADAIAEQITAKPDSVLGLATGSTPIGVYQKLVKLYKSGELSFSRATAFNLDEYYPIKKSSNQSYFHFMKQNLFDHVDFKPQNTFIPNSESGDAAAECDDYEKRILAAGIDLQILGLGLNGHIGFNEPSDHFPKFTHLVELDDSTINANARFFANAHKVPRRAITMGIGTIMRAKRILLLVTGAAKAEIAAKVISGDISPRVPGSVLQLHQDCVAVLDKEVRGQRSEVRF